MTRLSESYEMYETVETTRMLFLGGLMFSSEVILFTNSECRRANGPGVDGLSRFNRAHSVPNNMVDNTVHDLYLHRLVNGLPAIDFLQIHRCKA